MCELLLKMLKIMISWEKIVISMVKMFRKYFFKIISSKKYSTVFNVFRFIVKLRSSGLTSTWNHSIRLIHRWGISSRPLFQKRNLNYLGFLLLNKNKTICLQLFHYEKICLSYFVDNVFQTRDHFQTIALLKSEFHKKLTKLTRVYNVGNRVLMEILPYAPAAATQAVVGPPRGQVHESGHA